MEDGDEHQCAWQTEPAAASAEGKKLGYRTILLTHDFITIKELWDAQQLIVEQVGGGVSNVAGQLFPLGAYVAAHC